MAIIPACLPTPSQLKSYLWTKIFASRFCPIPLTTTHWYCSTISIECFLQSVCSYILPHTRFRVNALMSSKSLFETGAISDVYVTEKRFEPKITQFTYEHSTIQQSWPLGYDKLAKRDGRLAWNIVYEDLLVKSTESNFFIFEKLRFPLKPNNLVEKLKNMSVEIQQSAFSIEILCFASRNQVFHMIC